MPKRIVGMSVIPGEPVDGSGRVCIHLFVPSASGPFVEPHVLHPIMKDGEPVKNQLEASPTRGRIACDPRRRVAPVVRRGVTIVTSRTDDPRAVTCPKCIASVEYAEAMGKLTTAESGEVR